MFAIWRSVLPTSSSSLLQTHSHQSPIYPKMQFKHKAVTVSNPNVFSYIHQICLPNWTEMHRKNFQFEANWLTLLRVCTIRTKLKLLYQVFLTIPLINTQQYQQQFTVLTSNTDIQQPIHISKYINYLFHFLWPCYLTVIVSIYRNNSVWFVIETQCVFCQTGIYFNVL